MTKEELLEKLRRKVRYYSILGSAIPKDRLVQGKKLGIEECIKIIENDGIMPDVLALTKQEL